MTWVHPIPGLSFVMVFNQQGTIVHVFRTAEGCEIKFSNFSPVEWVTS
jgi:hypothetical protein